MSTLLHIGRTVSCRYLYLMLLPHLVESGSLSASENISSNMTPHKKKCLTYVTIGIFFLLQGVEYAVILPTLWLYIEEEFHAEPYMLGLVLSAFSFSGLLSSPLMGRWSDITHNTKVVLLVANIFQVVGSVMYFLGLNVWFLVGARFVAGIGSGVSSALFADISRVTTTEERTPVMSVFMAVRQIGLLLGPGCNLFLRQLHFSIGPFTVDKYTSPGAFMAALWLLHELLSLIMYWNLPALKMEETLNRVQHGDQTCVSNTSRYLVASSIPNMESPLMRPTPSFSINSQNHLSTYGGISPLLSSGHNEPIIEDYPDLTMSNTFIEEAEKLMGDSQPEENSVDFQQVPTDTSLSDNETRSLSRANTQSSLGATSGNRDFDNLYDNSYNNGFESDEDGDWMSSHSSSNRQQHRAFSFKFLYHEFVREEVIALLFTSFVAFFNQVGIETLFTPLSRKLLDWGELQNSYLYCGAGAEVILVFFLVRYLSKKVSDRWLLLLGFLVLTATIAVSTWFIPQAKPGQYSYNLAGLLLVVFFDVFALPFLAVTSASLYSKITKEDTQGFSQGVRQLTVGLGTIMAPLWAGGLLNHLTLNFAVMLSMIGLGLMMLLLSFKRLNEDMYQTRKQHKRSNRHCQVPNGVVTQSWDETQHEQEPLLHGDI